MMVDTGKAFGLMQLGFCKWSFCVPVFWSSNEVDVAVEVVMAVVPVSERLLLSVSKWIRWSLAYCDD
ncbi:hypothetical protein E2542_SST06684 [Spatholobus suberectus]|nr:hypothetical protein E2542_SST06684 [Spatholobus suberectus]